MKAVIMVFLCMINLTVMAQPLIKALPLEPFKAGEYSREGSGEGALRIGPFENGYQTFEIETVTAGPNYDTCSLSGKIQGNIGIDDGGVCEVIFYRDDSGIVVAVDQEMMVTEKCKGYCGLRAFFWGHYLEPKGGNTPAQGIK